MIQRRNKLRNNSCCVYNNKFIFLDVSNQNSDICLKSQNLKILHLNPMLMKLDNKSNSLRGNT